jgi:pimeloyl-ACP methyl ester carboxylesterase
VADNVDEGMMSRGYAETSVGQVHYRREGRGPTLLLFSASGRSSRMFTRLMPLIASRFDAIALDTPGFGGSDPLPEGATIEQLAEAFLAVLDQLGIARTHLYGLHTGNKIGAAMAARWPARIDRLVLAGQSHSLIPDQAKRNARILEIVREYVETPEHETSPALADWASLFRRVSDLWWDRKLIGGGFPAAERAFARELVLDEIEAVGTAGLYAANFAYDLGHDLARISVPTLVLEVATPAEDRAIGRQGPSVQALIPGSQLRTLEEPRGHTLTLENRAQDLAEILLGFLLSAA